ncbi:MAG: hypothetical protein AB7O59_11755 [Pirellulales bacterium]
MKVKMKFDLQAIKDAALRHGEKIAFAVVGLVFLLFVYSALKRESLDAAKQPDRLNAKAGEARNHVTNSTFDAKKDSLAVVDYAGRAKREMVLVKNYVARNILNPPEVEQKTQRGTPAILPIEQLRAAGGFGVFALKGGNAAPRPKADAENRRATPPKGKDEVNFPAGDASKLVPQAYTVITGLVPVNKQAQEFSRVFAGALGEKADRDQPTYLRVVLQRAEIDPAQPTKEPQWQDVPSADAFVSQWEGVMDEESKDKFVEPALVSKLGPLVIGKWGNAVRHPAIDAAQAALEEHLAQETQPAVGVVQPAGRQLPVGQAQPGAPAVPAANKSRQEHVIEYRLCRLFDFSVQPSKKYRYRAKVVLANPNFGLPPAVLQKPETNRIELLEADWSNPSSTAAVPDRYGVLAGGVGEKNRSDDPSVSLVATAIEPNEGVEAAAKFDVWRGSVINASKENVEAHDPRNGVFVKLPTMDFMTGIVVVDIFGGKPLSKRTNTEATGPVEVLVMDPEGNLTVRREGEDHEAVEFRVPSEVAVKKKEKDKDDTIPQAKRGGTSRPPKTKAAPNP